MKPRIFVSAVTKELATIRQQVANTLLAMGYEPVWQDNFDLSPDDLRLMLRKKINGCKAVIQIVGDAYGAEPPQPDATFGRCSYTQYEALYAKARGKDVYYLPIQTGGQVDLPADQVDVAKAETPEALADLQIRRDLQASYKAAILGGSQVYYPVQSRQDAELNIFKLKSDLEKHRRNFSRWMAGVTTSLVVIIALTCYFYWTNQQAIQQVPQQVAEKTGTQIKEAQQETNTIIEKTTEKAIKSLTNPVLLADRLRKEIRTTAEEKIKTIPQAPGRWELVAQVEKERDLALGRVEDLIKLIQESLQTGADEIFQRAIEILESEGTEATLKYLESRRAVALEKADRHAEQAKLSQEQANREKEQRNQALKPLVLEAELLEGKLKFKESLALRSIIAEKAPDWFEARNYLGLTMYQLAQYKPAEEHYRAAVKLADSRQEAVALNNLAQLLLTTNRLAEAEYYYLRALEIEKNSLGVNHPIYATILNDLGDLYQSQGKFTEAEIHLKEALCVHEKSFGEMHPWVATSLNNLATLFIDTNRLAEAEPLLRRALAIDEAILGKEHPNVAIALNNLAQLLQATNRLAEAESLMQRALGIDEAKLGKEHPNVAYRLNNLATLLYITNQLAEAEPLYRRALAIDEASLGKEHPNVARDLNNIAALLQATNRLAEAEPLMRRALAIDEASFGKEHPKVAVRLNNLATLLYLTNRLAEAEPLYSRALAINEASLGKEHPAVAIDLNNLTLLLHATNRLAEAEQLSNRAIHILQIFKLKTGHQHIEFEKSLLNYLSISTELFDSSTQILDKIESLNNPSLVAKLLNTVGFIHYKSWKYLPAIRSYQAALILYEKLPEEKQELLQTRVNLYAALRDDGLLEQAQKSLVEVIPQIDEFVTKPDIMHGRSRFHLAKCEVQLNNLKEAEKWVLESLQKYAELNAELSKAAEPLRQQSLNLYREILQAQQLPEDEIKSRLEKVAK